MRDIAHLIAAAGTIIVLGGVALFMLNSGVGLIVPAITQHVYLDEPDDLAVPLILILGGLVMVFAGMMATRYAPSEDRTPENGLPTHILSDVEPDS